MGCKLLIVASLCTLQFGLYQAFNGNSNYGLFEMRMPVKYFSNPPPYQQNYQLPRSFYPNYPQFNTGRTSCNKCRKSPICEKRCSNKTNVLKIKFEDSPIVMSFPLGTTGERINLIIPQAPKANISNSNEKINLFVKVTPKDKKYPQNNNENGGDSVSTTGYITASKNGSGEWITLNNTAVDSDSNVEVQVIVNKKDSGAPLQDTQFNSVMMDEDNKGDTSITKTTAEIDDKAKNNSPSGDNQPNNKENPDKPQNNDDSTDKNTGKVPVTSNSSDKSNVSASPVNDSPDIGHTSPPTNKPPVPDQNLPQTPSNDNKSSSSTSTSAESEAATNSGDTPATPIANNKADDKQDPNKKPAVASTETNPSSDDKPSSATATSATSVSAASGSGTSASSKPNGKIATTTTSIDGAPTTSSEEISRVISEPIANINTDSTVTSVITTDSSGVYENLPTIQKDTISIVTSANNENEAASMQNSGGNKVLPISDTSAIITGDGGSVSGIAANDATLNLINAGATTTVDEKKDVIDNAEKIIVNTTKTTTTTTTTNPIDITAGSVSSATITDGSSTATTTSTNEAPILTKTVVETTVDDGTKETNTLDSTTMLSEDNKDTASRGNKDTETAGTTGKDSDETENANDFILYDTASG